MASSRFALYFYSRSTPQIEFLAKRCYYNIRRLAPSPNILFYSKHISILKDSKFSFPIYQPIIFKTVFWLTNGLSSGVTCDFSFLSRSSSFVVSLSFLVYLPNRIWSSVNTYLLSNSQLSISSLYLMLKASRYGFNDSHYMSFPNYILN